MIGATGSRHLNRRRASSPCVTPLVSGLRRASLAPPQEADEERSEDGNARDRNVLDLRTTNDVPPGGGGGMAASRHSDGQGRRARGGHRARADGGEARRRRHAGPDAHVDADGDDRGAPGALAATATAAAVGSAVPPGGQTGLQQSPPASPRAAKPPRRKPLTLGSLDDDADDHGHGHDRQHSSGSDSAAGGAGSSPDAPDDRSPACSRRATSPLTRLSVPDLPPGMSAGRRRAVNTLDHKTCALLHSKLKGIRLEDVAPPPVGRSGWTWANRRRQRQSLPGIRKAIANLLYGL